MAYELPFPIPPEQVIASYDYADIAAGTGITNFYGANAYDGVFFLTVNRSVHSMKAVTSIAANAGFNKNFEIKFNTSRIINGIPIVNIPVHRETGNSADLTATITIYHYDGTTATQLSQGAGVSLTSAGTYTAIDQMICIKLPQITNKQFKSNEILRINVTTTQGNNIFQLGHDPIGRTNGNFINTQMVFYIPFKILG